MTAITEPLILWRGSHDAGSGKGCAMNVVSWENGDTTITDFPACSDPMLARIVQGVNDALAGTDGRLAPEDALLALRLGHATVGTSAHGLDDLDLKRVYVRCAVFAARKVVDLDRTGTALPAIRAAEAWADNPTAAAAAAAAAYTDTARTFRVDLAGEVIALFKVLTGTGQPEPEAGIVARALRDMATVR